MRNLLKRLATAPAADETGSVAIGGEVIAFKVIRNRRRRRTISYTMEADQSLRILAPQRTSTAYITSMLQKRSGSILRRMEVLKNQPPPRNFMDGEQISYLGHTYRLQLTQDETRSQGCRVWPRRFEINIADENLSPEALRDEARMELRLWMKKRAKVKLHKRMDLWAQILGVDYRKLILTETERQWGSCNVQNVIRLNWRLIMAPLPLIDYVAAHELCHVTHKNHGMRFWRMLARVMPDFKARRQTLRQVGHGLVV